MKLNFYLRLCTHFFIAVIFAFVIASLFHSQLIMAELSKVGVDILFKDRLSMSIDDLLGLYPTYWIMIAVSYFISFIVAGLLIKQFTLSPYIVYFLMGGGGITVVLLTMQPILGITLLAGAPSTFGLVCQSVAGAMGGVLFANFRSKQHVSIQ